MPLYTVGRTAAYAPYLGRPDHYKAAGGLAFNSTEAARVWLEANVEERWPGRRPDEFSVYEIEVVPTKLAEDGCLVIASDSRIMRRMP